MTMIEPSVVGVGNNSQTNDKFGIAKRSTAQKESAAAWQTAEIVVREDQMRVVASVAAIVDNKRSRNEKQSNTPLHLFLTSSRGITQRSGMNDRHHSKLICASRLLILKRFATS